MQEIVKRSFMLGDEWIYLKIYTGTKIADDIIAEYLHEIINRCFENQFIDHWFFIRYSDPDFHIRFRLHLKDINCIGKVIVLINSELGKILESDIAWKVQYDMYNRELERYGGALIEQSEQIFYRDSEMILNFLRIYENQPNQDLKWLFGLRSIDGLLEDFGLPLIQKKMLMEILKTSFEKEMGLNKMLKKQLSTKYNQLKKQIADFLENNIELKKLIDKKSSLTSIPVALIKKNITDASELNYLISSHIHMSMNRLFKDRNRQAEFVSYQMLYYYYDSKLARLKYDGSKIQKQSVKTYS